MASDGVNITEDADMAECDGNKVVTMVDVLQEQQDFEEDANAVLGASDDKNCTYLKGYIKRQAIYACVTCCPEAKADPAKRAGVCLACSLNCHENHELVELYTKRNFRCDCGNPKFSSHPCQFVPSKPDLNDDNIYNQNFSGLYCICQRPYPDPDATFEEDMIQCIVCEDWLHASHLDAAVPAHNQYSEMICKGCMNKNEFLHDYSFFAVNVESVDVDIITVSGNKSVDALHSVDAKKVVTNGDVENSSNLEAENKEVSGKENKANDIGPNVDSEPNEISSTIQENKMDVDGDSQSGKESECTETKENRDDAEKSNQSVTIEESQKVIDESSESKQVNDTIGNPANKPDEVVETRERKDEESGVKNDNDNADVKGDGENADINKTEAQLLNEDLSHEETTVQISEKPTGSEEKLSDSVEKEDDTTNENRDKTTEAISDPVDSKPTAEDSNIQVPDTSQADKSDSVMDAIDELLKDPIENESKDNESTEIIKEAGEETSAKMDTTENSETRKSDEIDMSENVDKQDEKNKDSSNKESNNENSNAVNSETIENGDTKMDDSTDKNQSRTDVDEKSTANEKVNSATSDNEALNVTENINEPSNNTSKSEDKNNVSDTNENKRKHNLELVGETSPKKAKLDVSKCVRPKDVKKVFKGATFWPSNFRQKLCTCGECVAMYKDLHVLFLTDSEDTVFAYESLGKENVDGLSSQYEKGLQALSSLDRIQQINALTEYNRMRDKLLNFLKSFRDRKEIVKEEDIKAFFADMKPRREPDGVYFCT